jgi:hypothetical protein
MRLLLLAAGLSLALAPALAVHAAEKCRDSAGKVIACPKDTKKDGSEVTVASPPPFNRPPPNPTKLSPDRTIPPMATALCQDGFYSNATNQAVACEVHGGVKQWVH